MRFRLTRDFGASSFCSLSTSTITITITIITSRLPTKIPKANLTTHYRGTADDADAEDSFHKVEARGGVFPPCSTMSVVDGLKR